MKAYTVSQLAKTAGVSVRTLHHYDHIGLLTPSSRTPAGYRQYNHSDLLQLQQILFFRELDFPLDEIREIMDDPQFDPVNALEHHRQMLAQRAQRLARLIDTVEKTIQMLKEYEMTLSDEELYEGFSKEQIDRYEREVREMYDPEIVNETNHRIRKLSKSQWQVIKEEGEQVTRKLAELADRDPSDPEVQVLIARHHAWIENFYPASTEYYRGLAGLYTSHEEFRAYYDQFRPGLADFIAAGMNYFSQNLLAGE